MCASGGGTHSRRFAPSGDAPERTKQKPVASSCLGALRGTHNGISAGRLASWQSKAQKS